MGTPWLDRARHALYAARRVGRGVAVVADHTVYVAGRGRLCAWFQAPRNQVAGAPSLWATACGVAHEPRDSTSGEVHGMEQHVVGVCRDGGDTARSNVGAVRRRAGHGVWCRLYRALSQ